MALNASQDKATPPLHFQGLMLRFSKEKGEWIYQGLVRQRGSYTKVYLGSSISMTYVASKIASAKCQGLSACKRRKCMRRAPDDSMERFRLMALLFKEWVPKDLFGAIQMRSQVFHDDGKRPKDLCWLLAGPGAHMAASNPKGMGAG